MTHLEYFEKQRSAAIRGLCVAKTERDGLEISAEIGHLDAAIKALTPQVETNIFDQEEIHHNCTVQILTNSKTGETSIGWWEENDHA